MEHSPPPFFKTGTSPLARLLIFASLSLAFLLADARFNYLVTLRQVAAIIVYPFQRLAPAAARGPARGKRPAARAALRPRPPRHRVSRRRGALRGARSVLAQGG